MKKLVICIMLLVVPIFAAFHGRLDYPLMAQAKNRTILHLNIDDFKNFCESEWRSLYLKREYNLWFSPFVCWDRSTGEILIPSCDHSRPKYRKFPQDMAKKLENLSLEKNSERRTLLINRADMYIISLKKLVVENKYPHVKSVKNERFVDENDIEFYILDLCIPKTVKVYYGVRDHHNRLKLSGGETAIEDSMCFENWEEFLSNPSMGSNIGSVGVSFSKKERYIKVEVSGVIGGNTLIENCSSINNAGLKFIGNPIHYYISNLNVQPIIPAIVLTFDLASTEDLEKLNAGSIWLVENQRSIRLTHSSIYSQMLEYYEKTGNSLNGTFKLLCVRTRNFNGATYEFNGNETIRDTDLPRIMDFIRGICGQRNEPIQIQLIGYADEIGKGLKDWKERNKKISQLRAINVQKWLTEKVKKAGLIDRIKFLPVEGCKEKYYNYDGRYVEIKIF